MKVKGFFSSLIVEHLDFAWRLTEPFLIILPSTPKLNDNTIFIVPDNFKTDFASVPRIFWTIVPPATGRHVKAAVLHDWLYYTALVDKETADWLFYKAMLLAGVNIAKAHAMYLAVKYFGHKAWYSHREKGHTLEYWLEKHGNKSVAAKKLQELGIGFILSSSQAKYDNSETLFDLSDFLIRIAKKRE